MNAQYRISMRIRTPGRVSHHRGFKDEIRYSRSVSRHTGHVVGERRVIDRRGVRYSKKLVGTVTGEVLRDDVERLDEHRDHGDARR